MQDKTDTKIAMKVSYETIIVNVVLSAFKLAAGILASSGAMISDAVHSASDVLSTFVVIIGVKLSSRSSDTDHPYGHERLESIAAILLSLMLGFTGLGIGYSGVIKIWSGDIPSTPGVLALVAAILSIVVKEGMYWYTRHAANITRSGALMADAWHHRSDALSSVGSFVGIFGARLGFPVLDPLASVIICIFILKAAFDIFSDAAGRLTDKAGPEELEHAIYTLAKEHDGVKAVDMLKTRLFGNKVFVDIEIAADGNRSLADTHEIAQRLHDAVEAAHPEVKHCMIHVNPT